MKWTGPPLSLALAIVTLAALAPMLATAPQNGDGAELIALALQGGVPHPSGFPLQAWLDRLAIALPLEHPATRIALVSLLAHAGTAFFVSEGLRRVGAGVAARVIAAAACVLFPPLWALALQPELMALAHLGIAAMLWHLCGVVGREATGFADAAVLGVLVALAGAQHPIALAAAPIFVTSAVLLIRKPDGRWLRLAAMAVPFSIVFVGLYASLPLLRTDALWPDWGKISTAPEVVRVMLRQDYGGFAFSGFQGETGRGALPLFGLELLRSWNLLLIPLAIGIWGAWAGPRRLRPLRLAALGALALGGILLAMARLPGTDASVDATLERFDGPAVLPAALLLGLGVDRITRRTRGALRWIAVGVAVAALAATAAQNHARVDASRDVTLDVFRRALGASLPPGAIWIGWFDVEASYGAETATGVRYPVHSRLMGLDWYRERVAPKLEPRLYAYERLPGEHPSQGAYRAGHEIVSTHPGLIGLPGRRIEPHGLMYLTARDWPEESWRRSARAAVALCEPLRTLRPLPADGHGFSRSLWPRFAAAYAETASALDRAGRTGLGWATREIARALQRADDRETWVAACDRLGGLLEGS